MPKSLGSGHGWLCGCEGSGTVVDLFGIDVFVECFSDGLVETCEQLHQGFCVAAHAHGQSVMLIAGYGDAADGVLIANRDLVELDQLFDVRQRQANRIWLRGRSGFYAAAGRGETGLRRRSTAAVPRCD